MRSAYHPPLDEAQPVTVQPPEASDHLLLIAVARRDRGGLDEIYRRHAPAVYALARRLLEDRVAAQRVVHDVFVELWTTPESLDPERESLRSFLLAQTYRIAADNLESAHDRARGWPSLSVEECEVLELACFPGCTYRDIAMLVGRTESAVRTSIRTGLRRIQSSGSGSILTNAGLE